MPHPPPIFYPLKKIESKKKNRFRIRFFFFSWQWWYYSHRSRDSVSPVCWIFYLTDVFCWGLECLDVKTYFVTSSGQVLANISSLFKCIVINSINYTKLIRPIKDTKSAFKWSDVEKLHLLFISFSWRKSSDHIMEVPGVKVELMP